ncbi:MAG: hypothetical protein ACQES1_03820 [Bacteroidota bacterium]
MKNRDKDLDLVDLYAGIVSFIRRHLILLIIAGVLGVGLGIYKSYTVSNVYKKSCIIQSKVMTQSHLYQYFTPLEIMVQNKSYKRIASSFELDREIAQKLMAVSIDSVDNNSLSISFEATDSVALLEICNNIINGINNTPIFLAKFEEAQMIKEKHKQKIQEEIDELNQYQEKLLNVDFEKNASGNYYPQLAGTYQEIMELYQKEKELEAQLHDKQPVNISSQSFIIKKRLNFLKNLLIYPVIFILVAALFGFIRDIHKAYKLRSAE